MLPNLLLVGAMKSGTTSLAPHIAETRRSVRSWVAIIPNVEMDLWFRRTIFSTLQAPIFITITHSRFFVGVISLGICRVGVI